MQASWTSSSKWVPQGKARQSNTKKGKARQSKAKASKSKQKIRQRLPNPRKIVLNAPITQNSSEQSRITQNPLKSIPQTTPNPPRIHPKPFKIETKSSPDASKSTFEDHSKYKHEKKRRQNGPRGPKSLQIPPKAIPNGAQDAPKSEP